MKIIIGCGGVILKNKKLLLTKRISTKENYPNCWTLPAGTLEDGDKTLAAAATREVKEEVNLDFIANEKLGFYETNLKDKRIIGFVFLGEWSGDIKPLETEISDIGWFTYEETKKLEIAFSYNQTIEDLYNRGLIK